MIRYALEGEVMLLVDGNKIKARREELKLTMEQLGEMLGVNKATIQRYEKGKIDSMPYITFFKLLIALRTDPKHILPDEEYELIEKSDELRGFYETVNETQAEIMRMMKDLPQDDTTLIAALVRGLLERHKE